MAKAKKPSSEFEPKPWMDTKFWEDLYAAIDAFPLVKERNKEIHKRFITVLKNADGYEYSDEGQSTTLLALCQALPDLDIKDIQSALIDMDDVSVSTDTGPIKFPAHYFKPSENG
jgi:hypothetical protein